MKQNWMERYLTQACASRAALSKIAVITANMAKRNNETLPVPFRCR